MNLKLFFILFFLTLFSSANFALASQKIDLNTASLEDLTKISNIGETRAQIIISSRPFYSVDDLIGIKGIGEKTLETIKQQGLAWVDPALQQEPQTTKNTSVATPVTQVDLNNASLEDLTKISHIGEARAQSIVSSRPFYSVDDLIEIRGIGEKTLEAIKQQGLAWVDPELELKRPIIKKDNPLEKRIAALSEAGTKEQNKNFASITLIALIISLFSGGIFFFFRKLIDKNN